LRSVLSKCLLALSRLAEAVFQCYLNQDYIEKYYYYEEELQERLAIALSHMTRLRQQNHPELEKLEHIFEIILSLGNLRYRVSDSTTFDVVKKELTDISVNLTMAFADKQKLADFLESIYRLEDVNRSVLQVVAHEPMAFLLFIHDLHVLCDEMQELLSERAVI